MNTVVTRIRSALVILALSCGVAATAQAGALQMAVSDRGVYGERELIAGDHVEAVRRLEYALALAGEARSLRAPILNDLCVAHTLLGQTDLALLRCDAAVAAGRETGRALNNRAIARIVAGDIEGAGSDLRAALAAPGTPAAARDNLRLIAGVGNAGIVTKERVAAEGTASRPEPAG